MLRSLPRLKHFQIPDSHEILVFNTAPANKSGPLATPGSCSYPEDNEVQRCRAYGHSGVAHSTVYKSSLGAQPGC